MYSDGSHRCYSNSNNKSEGGGGGGVSRREPSSWGFQSRGIPQSSPSSSSSTFPTSPVASNLEGLVESVRGVMSSVKTLSRHPVLATVIWLLGGNPAEQRRNNHDSFSSCRQRGKDENEGMDSSSSCNTTRNNSSDSSSSSSKAKIGTPPIRRLKWNSNAPAPSANSGDRIVYYTEQQAEGRGERGDTAAFSGDTRNHRSCGLVHQDSQMIYPESIAVEKITHMDRLEMDDLERRAITAERVAESSSAAAAAAPTSTDDHTGSPQWGWYVTLTPPKPEFFHQNKKDGVGVANKRHTTGAASTLRPAMPTATPS